MNTRRRLLAYGVALVALVYGTGPLHGQSPLTILSEVRTLALDSLTDGLTAAYFPAVARPVAERILSAVNQQIETAASAGVPPFRIRIAILDSVTWHSISSYPYGLPHYVGPPASLAIVPAGRPAPEGADTLLSEITDELVAVGHEVGHLLTFALAPEELRDSLAAPQLFAESVRDRLGRIYEVPVWYGELAANYFVTQFLRETHPTEAIQWADYVMSMANAPRQRYQLLSDMVKVYTDRTADGGRYMETPGSLPGATMLLRSSCSSADQSVPTAP